MPVDAPTQDAPAQDVDNQPWLKYQKSDAVDPSKPWLKYQALKPKANIATEAESPQSHEEVPPQPKVNPVSIGPGAMPPPEAYAPLPTGQIIPRLKTAAGTSGAQALGFTPENIGKAQEAITAKLPESLQTPFKIASMAPVAVDKTIAGISDWATTPSGAAQLVAAGIPVTRIPMAIKFFHDMAKGAGESAADMVDKWHKGDLQGFADALVGTIANTLGAGAIGFHGVKTGIEKLGGEKNAEAVRSNTGQVPQQGGQPEVLQNKGGEDLQLSKSESSQPVGAREPQAEIPLKDAVELNERNAKIFSGEDADVQAEALLTGRTLNDANLFMRLREAKQRLVKKQWEAAEAEKERLKQERAAKNAPAKPEEKAPEVKTPVAGAVSGAAQIAGAAPAPSEKPKVPYAVEHEPETGQWHLVKPNGDIEESFDYAEDAQKALQKANSTGIDSSSTAGIPAKQQISPEDQAHLDAERAASDVPIEMSEESDPNSPFAKRNKGQVATIDRVNGKILVNPAELSKWLDNIPMSRRKLAIQSLVAEERIHLATPDNLANEYWKGLSPWERVIARRRYGPVQGMSDTLWGHEAMRYRIQQLSRMAPREVAEAALRERWSLRALNGLERVIRAIKSVTDYKTRARMRAILEKVQMNLAIGKIARRGGTPRSMSKAAMAYAMRQAQELKDEADRLEKQGEKKDADELRGMAESLMRQTFDDSFRQDAEESHPDWQVTVQHPIDMGGGKKAPGYVQIDSVKGGENQWSKSLETLAKEGVKVPDFSSLPQGKYSYDEAVKMLNQREPGARRKESKDQLKMDSLLNATEFEKIQQAIRGGPTGDQIMRDAERAKFKRAQDESGQPPTPGVTPKKPKKDWSTPFFELPGSETVRSATLKPTGAEGKFEKEQSTKAVQYGQKPGEGFEFKPTQAVPEQERKSAEAAGAMPILNAAELSAHAHWYVGDMFNRAMAAIQHGEHAPLNFNEFARYMRGKAYRITDNQLQEMWQDISYARLSHASDDEIRDLTYSVLASKPSVAKEAEAAPGELGGFKGGSKGRETSKNQWTAMADAMLTFEQKSDEEKRMKQSTLDLTVGKKDFPVSLGKEKKFKEPSPQPKVRMMPYEEFLDHEKQMAQSKGVPYNKEAAEKKYFDLRAQVKADRDLGEEAAIRQENKDEKAAVLRKTKLIAELYKELALPDTGPQDLHPDEISLNEIRYGGGGAADAVENLTPDDSRNLKYLNGLLIDGARRNAKDPNTWTKRLTVMQSKSDGTVHMVSTYSRGGEAMLLDPASPGREHLPLNRMIGRYRMIQTILRDSPVDKFKKSWDNLLDYMNDFGAEARRIEQHYGQHDQRVGEASQYIEGQRVTQRTGESEGIPGSMVEEGASGHLQGPFRSEIENVTGAGRGSMAKSRSTPLTAPEAASLSSFVKDELGKAPESAADVEAVLYNIAKFPPKPSVMSALRKVAAMIEDKVNPDQGPARSVEELLMHLSQRLYEDQTLENTLKESETAAAARAGEDVGAPGIPAHQEARDQSQAALSGTPGLQDVGGKELFMPIARRAPTDVRPENLPPGTPMPEFTHAPPVPEGTTKPSTPEMLSPEAQDYVRQQAAANNYYTPIHIRERKDRGLMLRERSPMAVNKSRIQAEITDAADAIDRKRRQFGSSWKRRQTGKTIKQDADGADNEAAIIGEGVRRSLQMISEDEMVRASPMITLATGKVGQRPKILNPYSVAKGQDGKFHVMKGQEDVAAHELEGEAIEQVRAWNEANNRKEPPKYFYYDKSELQKQISQFELAGIKAEQEMNDPRSNRQVRRAQRMRKEAAEKMLNIALFVKNHWEAFDNSTKYEKLNQTGKELRDMAFRSRQELYDNLLRMEHGGIRTSDFGPNYFPGRYEGEIFNMNSITFGGDEIIGSKANRKKTFKSYAEALATGPYVPKSYSAPDIVGHSVRQGMRAVNRNAWGEMLKDIRDPASGLPVATSPVPQNPEMITHENGQKDFTYSRWTEPGPEYKNIYIAGSGQPVSVLKPYAGLVDACFAHSLFEGHPLGEGAMYLSGMLKHGVVLIADTFHPSRLFQYAVALNTGNLHPRGAHTALFYRPEDIPRAVELGWVHPENAAWAMDKVSVNKNGIQQLMTNQEVLHYMVSRGLNASRIGDALYKDAVEKIPLVGKYIYHGIKGVGLKQFNSWMFDRLLPGLISDSAVRNFRKFHARNPDIPMEKLARDVITDINTFYGNLGRQGVLNHPTFRDLAQVTLLAPMWQEGLIGKEVRAASRITGVSYLTGRRGLPWLGTLGEGIAKGLLMYAALTQIINLITKGQPTWKNEKGHQLDAWIPVGQGTGVWVSPMSVFAELTHDVIRLGESKGSTWAGVIQIGANKLGPMGRFMHVLATGESSMGQKLTSTRAVMGSALSELAPVPISLGKLGQELGSLVTERIPPLAPGSVQRQMFASVGVKTQIQTPIITEMTQKAMQFVKNNNLRPGEMDYNPTDEPNYSKLRHAITIGDSRGAIQIFRALSKGGERDAAIFNAMNNWARRPFTGGNNTEMEWMESFYKDPIEMKKYHDAVVAKYQLNATFQKWYFKHYKELR